MSFIMFLIILFAVTSISAVVDLCFFIINKKQWLSKWIRLLIEINSIIIGPWLFLFISDTGQVNDCCSDSAFFSPEHRLTIYVIIIICSITYFFTSHRKKLAPPLIELILSCFLLIGFFLNVFVAIQTEDSMLWLLGNVSIGALFLTTILKDHRLLSSETLSWDISKMNFFERICSNILRSHFFIKFPILLIFCLPILLLLSAILFVFGQKPDSSIKAFTETYKHGLSQWDHMCDNVRCGGHYLCSVAANGHKKLVKPQRFGVRHGKKIICNRQLLIANAFEELMEERFPGIHLKIRKRYNKVGNIVHRYYTIFQNKFFSDLIYVMMKPFEWAFLLILYLFDFKPENRIARQYLN